MAAEFKATQRYARMTARKARYVVDLIRGRSVNEALDTLRNDKHRASRLVEKILAAAVANALHNPSVKSNRLQIAAAYVNDAPLLFGRFRFRPGPMGRAMPIRKRLCHIHIKVTDPGATAAAAAEA